MATRGRKKGSGKGKNYFDQEVNDAIVQFNSIDSKLERDRLFNSLIYPALNKLVENIIHKWKFYNIEYDNLKTDTVIYLYETLSKYKPETGSKAFSYFTIVARNYLIKRAKEFQQVQNEVTNLEFVDSSRNIMCEVTKEDFDDMKSEFNAVWIYRLEKNIDKLFTNKREKSITHAFINILQSDVDIENKKLLYIYIREMLDLDSNQTQSITKTMNVLRENYKTEFRKYINE
jgi:hypothetical protein